MAVCALLASACAATASARDAVPLEVTTHRIPAIDAPRVKTRGTYPTVPRRLDAVNAQLLAVVRAEERRYARSVRTYHGPPGTGDGQQWLAVTVRVPSGKRVTIEELFAEPKKGLAALAEEARSRLVAANDCVKRSQDDPIVGDLNRKGFAPTARHYRHFALTAGGLAVGFDLGDVAGIPCGRVRVTVPYDPLRPLLSSLGNRLVDGVRAPK